MSPPSQWSLTATTLCDFLQHGPELWVRGLHLVHHPFREEDGLRFKSGELKRSSMHTK